MTTPNQMATALLTEHFRYTPLTLLDDIINTVNELIFRAINAVEEGFSDASPLSLGFALTPEQERQNPSRQLAALNEAKEAEIAAGVVQLESLLNATVDKDFDKFEIYTLRNILTVGREEEDLARWVRLEHYRDIDPSLTSLHGNNTNTNKTHSPLPTPEEIQLARRKVHETAKLNNLLKAEEARNAAILTQLHALLGNHQQQQQPHQTSTPAPAPAPLAFLTKDHAPTASNVQQTMTHLPALRTLLADLKKSLHALPPAARSGGPHRRGETPSGGEEDAEAKRRRYVEGRTRRALERRGVEIENAGAASAAVSGRRVGREEVEGLEAVVRGLQDGRRRTEEEDVEMGGV